MRSHSFNRQDAWIQADVHAFLPPASDFKPTQKMINLLKPLISVISVLNRHCSKQEHTRSAQLIRLASMTRSICICLACFKITSGNMLHDVKYTECCQRWHQYIAGHQASCGMNECAQPNVTCEAPPGGASTLELFLSVRKLPTF